MNIITGIIRKKEKGIGNGKQGTKTCNILEETRFLQFISILIMLLIFSACSSRQPVQDEEVSAKSDVKVSSPVMKQADRLVKYMAVTRYMQGNDIRTQMAGIVRQINCAVAGNIVTNQPVFVIQPQEAAALQKSKFNSQILKGLSDTVFAHLSGQIKTLNVQVGDFVQAGDVLATCIRANSMRVIVYVPVEKSALVEKVKNCILLLPDGSTVGGRISGKLPAAESQDQTQAYIIEPVKPVSLAENINLTVQFTAEKLQDALFVPESAVLGNEEQTNFWVMKLMNDSTCIKVPVEKGLEQDSLVQVIGASLSPSDRVISEGAYGLADSAKIQVIKGK